MNLTSYLILLGLIITVRDWVLCGKPTWVATILSRIILMIFMLGLMAGSVKVFLAEIL